MTRFRNTAMVMLIDRLNFEALCRVFADAYSNAIGRASWELMSRATEATQAGQDQSEPEDETQ